MASSGEALYNTRSSCYFFFFKACKRNHTSSCVPSLHPPSHRSYPPFFLTPEFTGRGLVTVPADRGGVNLRLPGDDEPDNCC